MAKCCGKSGCYVVDNMKTIRKKYGELAYAKALEVLHEYPKKCTKYCDKCEGWSDEKEKLL